jgi:peroxiredoxin
MEMKAKIQPASWTSMLILLAMGSFTASGAGYRVGDKVTDFKLKNVDGKMVSLADYSAAKGFIVVFTCNHCPFAQAYEQRIIELDKKFAAKGYPVIAVNPNDKDIVPEDSYEEMQARAKEKNYPFPYVYDESQEMARTYGATRTPHVYILQKDGSSLVVKYIGAIDDNTDDPSAVKTRYVENALGELLQGKSVTQDFTKAIGCTIKWKQ